MLLKVGSDLKTFCCFRGPSKTH